MEPSSTPTSETKPKRKRRTKAEIEAEKSSDPGTPKESKDELVFGYSMEELNKISQGYIYQLFENTPAPAKIAYDAKLLEKHCYELAMKLFFFYDTNSPEFRALVLDTHKLFEKAVNARIRIYKELGN